MFAGRLGRSSGWHVVPHGIGGYQQLWLWLHGRWYSWCDYHKAFDPISIRQTSALQLFYGRLFLHYDNAAQSRLGRASS
jgi:hypothetical protein